MNGHDRILKDQPLVDPAIEFLKSAPTVDVDLPASDKAPPQNYMEQLSQEAQACLNGFGSISGDNSTDDFILSKELLRVHPDAEWVLEVLREHGPNIREDVEKYERKNYWQPTIRRAWASLLAGFDVEEVITPSGSEFVSLFDIMNGPDPDPVRFSVADNDDHGAAHIRRRAEDRQDPAHASGQPRHKPGRHVMDQFKCEKMKVLYYMLEDSTATLKNRLQQMNADTPSPEDFVFKFTSPAGPAGLLQTSSPPGQSSA